MARNEKMNISYTIRAIDKFTATHQKLTKQLDSLERKFDSLESNKTINVDANTSDAMRDLERVDNKAEAVDGRKVLNIDVVSAVAMKQLETIDLLVKKLPKKPEVKVDADTAVATRQLNAVQRAINRIKGTVVVNIVAKGWKDFRRQMDSIADFSRDMGEIMQGLAVGSVLTVLPPVIMGIAGALGAVASAATPAALGFAGLAAVAIPTVTKIVDKYDELTEAREELALAKTEEEIAKATEKLEEVTASMTKGQLHAAEALDNFNGFYREFSKQFEPKILEIFTNSLNVAGNLLMSLEPAIHGTAESVNNLINAFNRNLEAEDMKAFFDWVGDTAGPNIEKLIEGVGNFLAGFANMMVAFDPLAQGFLDGFLDMSESFRDWSQSLSENKGFQDFIAMVQANAPAILSFLGNFTKFVWQVIEAMTPFSMWIMNVTNKFVSFMANLMETNPTVAKLVGFIMTAITAFMAFGAPLLLVANILKSTLGPAFGFIVRHAGTVVNMFKGPMIRVLGQVAAKLLWFAGGPVGIVIKIIILLATIIIANWDTIWAWTKKTWDNIKSWVVDTATKLAKATKEKVDSLVKGVIEKWNKAKSLTTSAWTAIKTAVTVAAAVLLSTVKSKFLSIVNNVRDKMASAKSTISNAWEKIKSTTSNAITSAVSTVKTKFTDMVDAAKDKMTSVRLKIVAAWDKIKAFLRDIDLAGMGRDIIQGLINGVTSKAKDLISAAKGAVQGAIDGAKNLLGIHSPSRLFFEFGEFVDKGFVNGILSMVNKVRSAGEKMASSAVPKGGVEIPLYTSIDPSSTPSAIRNRMLATQNANEEKRLAEAQEDRNVYIVMDKKIVGRLIADDVKAEIDSKGSKRLAIKGAVR